LRSGRRVTRTELDGSITIIADKYSGNSPNDAVVASDGSIWFTDPTYGIGGFYEGIKAEPEQEKRNVYRVDPKSGNIKVVVDDFVEPNGIVFSPDEKKLYVIDTGFTTGRTTRRICRWERPAGGDDAASATSSAAATGAGASSRNGHDGPRRHDGSGGHAFRHDDAGALRHDRQ
jgi:sugar lactone lactonase YvrE